jgi:hypothetical protein
LPQLAPDIYRCNNDNASGNGNESAYLTVSYYIVEILETRILVEDHGTLPGNISRTKKEDTFGWEAITTGTATLLQYYG